jgi:hypothetical protein
MKEVEKVRWQDRLAASEPMHAGRGISGFCDAGFRE